MNKFICIFDKNLLFKTIDGIPKNFDIYLLTCNRHRKIRLLHIRFKYTSCSNAWFVCRCATSSLFYTTLCIPHTNRVIYSWSFITCEDGGVALGNIYLVWWVFLISNLSVYAIFFIRKGYSILLWRDVGYIFSLFVNNPVIW